MAHAGHWFKCWGCGYVGEERELPPDPGHECGLDQCPQCSRNGYICCCYLSARSAESDGRASSRRAKIVPNQGTSAGGA